MRAQSCVPMDAAEALTADRTSHNIHSTACAPYSCSARHVPTLGGRCRDRSRCREFDQEPGCEGVRCYVNGLDAVNPVCPVPTTVCTDGVQEDVTIPCFSQGIRLNQPLLAMVAEIDKQAVDSSEPYGLQTTSQAPGPESLGWRPEVFTLCKRPGFQLFS